MGVVLTNWLVSSNSSAFVGENSCNMFFNSLCCYLNWAYCVFWKECDLAALDKEVLSADYLSLEVDYLTNLWVKVNFVFIYCSL